MQTVPQYARSTDPAVIAAMQQNSEHNDAFYDAVGDLSEKYTGSRDNAWVDRAGWRPRLIGLRMTPEQIAAAGGQWTKPDRIGAVRPYRKDPRSAEFQLAAEHVAIPGRPDVAWGEGLMGGGALFLYDGEVWSGFNFLPMDSWDGEGDWIEVLPSVFHKALEAARLAKLNRSTGS